MYDMQENPSSTAAKFFNAGEMAGLMAPVIEVGPLVLCCSQTQLNEILGLLSLDTLKIYRIMLAQTVYIFLLTLFIFPFDEVEKALDVMN